MGRAVGTSLDREKTAEEDPENNFGKGRREHENKRVKELKKIQLI